LGDGSTTPSIRGHLTRSGSDEAPTSTDYCMNYYNYAPTMGLLEIDEGRDARERRSGRCNTCRVMSKYSHGIVTVRDSVPCSTVDGEYEVSEEVFAMFCVDCPRSSFTSGVGSFDRKRGWRSTNCRLVKSLCYLRICIPNISYSHPPRPPTLYPRLIPVTSLLLRLRPEVPTHT